MKLPLHPLMINPPKNHWYLVEDMEDKDYISSEKKAAPAHHWTDSTLYEILKSKSKPESTNWYGPKTKVCTVCGGRGKVGFGHPCAEYGDSGTGNCFVCDGTGHTND